MSRKFIFEGGSSTRYHTAVVHDRQSIADHSFGVAWFCELLTQGLASKYLIMAALTHDLAEHMVGDIPSPSKRALGLSEQFSQYEDDQLKTVGLLKYHDALSPVEVKILKFADCLEGLQFCIKERRLGNKGVEIIFERFVSYISQAANTERDSREGVSVYAVYMEEILTVLDSLMGEIIDEWEGIIDDVR